MGALRERGTSNAITALLISALTRGIQIFVIRGSVKIKDWAFNNPQRPLANIHIAEVRMGGMLMTKSSPGSPRVGFGVLATLSPIFTATTTSQGERLD